MKINIFSLAATALAALCSWNLSAYSPEVRDVDINIVIDANGDVRVSERWDVCVAEGTEWYLVRRNLGDISVTDLAVRDETGKDYYYEGEWDVDRSMKAKAGRCGFVTKSDGVEICWGTGSYGDHVFDVDYRMTRSVKSLSDYDILHLQVVSPGLSSNPKHVRVTVSSAVGQLDTLNTRAWGFGYVGKVGFASGNVVFESTEKFRKESSVILLMRFDKGMFASPSVREEDFQTVLDRAMEGADFGEDDDDGASVIWAILTSMIIFGGSIIITVLSSRAAVKKILGMKKSEVGWSRTIPFDGNLQGSAFTLGKIGETDVDNSVASALILRMIYTKVLSVNKDVDGNVEIMFSQDGRQNLDSVAGELYDMMLEASGTDQVLQKKEFSRWAKKHEKRVYRWLMSVKTEGRAYLRENRYMSKSVYTVKGQQHARDLLGLKKFLKDSTLIAEKEAVEVALWKEYLVYGALFGIADKVAKQLKDIRPGDFEDIMEYDYMTMHYILINTRDLSSSILNAGANYGAGTGGSSSFGGGGGFSGGGAGGGAR